MTIEQTIANYYEVTLEDIMGESRKRDVVLARHMIFFMYQRFTHKSSCAIGKMFNRDHATVLYGIKMIYNYIDTDRIVGEDVMVLHDLIHDQDTPNTEIFMENDFFADSEKEMIESNTFVSPFAHVAFREPIFKS